MVSLLISFLIMAVIVWAVIMFADNIGLPHPFPLIIKVVAGVIVLVWLLRILAGSGSFAGIH